MASKDQQAADGQRPFVGRDAELAVLRSYVGQGRMVLVSGEPGVGKTRLAEELALEAHGRGAVVHWGRCWDGDGAPAFWPWIEIVRSIARIAEPDTLRAHLGSGAPDIAHLVDEVRARFPDLRPPARGDSKQARFRLFDSMATFLGSTATAAPLVLILEDLHWSDTSSVLLLRFVARAIGATRVLLIGTFRDTEVGKAHPLTDALSALARRRDCERMPLAGLSQTDVRHYLEHTFRGEAGDGLVASLHRDTDGNPFYLGEFVRLLAGQARQELTDSRPLDIPDTVRDVIMQRLAAYSPECLEVLRIAAVVGCPFMLAILQRLPEIERHRLLPLLSEATIGRLLTEVAGVDGGYRFAHSLIRETLYGSLSSAERVRLHRSVGEALEAHYGGSDSHVAQMAHHFLRAASDDHAERAIHYAMRAGERAADVFAHEDAGAYYAMALDALEQWQPSDTSRTCTVLLALGEARVRAGDPAGAEEAFLRSATLARTLDASELLARATLGLGEVERFHDRLAPLLEEALDRLGPGDGILRVRLLSRLAVTLYWSERQDHKRALSDEAVAMARRLGHTSTLAYALAGRIATLSGPDDVEERLATAMEMRRIAERSEDRELAMIARGWCIADRLALASVDHVRPEIDAFAAAAHDLRHPYFVWWSTAIRVMRMILEGRFADAEALAEEALRLGQRAIVADAMQVFAGHLYVLCLEQERLEQLEAIVSGFVRQFPHLPSGHCALALLHAERGHVAEAEAEMGEIANDDFRALPRNPEWLGCLAALAETSAMLPDAPHAETLYALLLPYRRRVIVAGLGVLCSGSVEHFLGMLALRLGRWDGAASHLGEALRVHQRIGSPPYLAYTRYECARLALARRAPGDVERATTLQAEACRAAESLGMQRLGRRLAALRSSLPESAARTVQRKGTLRKEGDFWTLRWERAEFRLRDSVGLHYLATLIANPRREFLAIDLVATRGRGRSPSGRAAVASPAGHSAEARLGDAGPLLDHRARRAYRARVDDLRAQLAEAQAFNDADRARRLQEEIDALASELARAVGLGGQGRRAGSPIERARVSATRAIWGAVRRIRQNDAALGRYLAAAIKTGTFCSYAPDLGIGVSWEL